MFTEVSTYKPTRLEEIVNKIYERLDIRYPDQIDIDFLAEAFSIKLLRLDARGKWFGDAIILDSRSSFEEQRETFFHELTHALRHSGNQMILNELMIEKQELEANRMPYYWLVPTFMLTRYLEPLPMHWLITKLSEIFCVTKHFMEKRLELYKSRMDMLAAEQQFAAVMENTPKYGRDYHFTWTVGRTEYLCDANGKILYHRKLADI